MSTASARPNTNADGLDQSVERRRERYEERTVDRRQVLRAGAWAAPVLVAAVGVPAIAASLDDIVISQAYVQDTNNGNFSVYFAVKTTATTGFTASFTITPTGALAAPFTGGYKFTGGLQSGGLSNKAAGAPVGYAGSIALGTQDRQGKIEAAYIKTTFVGTSQSLTITVSATGHTTKTRVLSAVLSS